MYSDIKKDEILSQHGQGISAMRNKEKPDSKESKGSQVNANEKYNRYHREPKADGEERLPKRKFPTAQNRRQYFQTKSRRTSN
jgi:hypothetical protein